MQSCATLFDQAIDFRNFKAEPDTDAVYQYKLTHVRGEDDQIRFKLLMFSGKLSTCHAQYP